MAAGAWYRGNNRCEFMVWAPQRKQVTLLLDGPPAREISMYRDDAGYWHTDIEPVRPGMLYRYRLDDTLIMPDPASFFQPEGVHGPSAVIDHAAYRWRDSAWQGIPLEQYIVYELHVGTFSSEGTFDGVVRHLDHLVSLGITAVEIMPVAQFPGSRNWGYDGVHPYAVQDSYGGPEGLKRLVDACHNKGLAVVLDVVYNHLGPEGNYLWEYGPYFTQNKYRTPWGWAVNYDDADSDHVREYIIGNALYWMEHFHVDALRLDAVHAIIDLSAKHILQELAERVDTYNRDARWKRFLIAESDLNDSRLIRKREQGGYGLDAQWGDDFHHALHALLTGEKRGYYMDFGKVSMLSKALSQGYVYTGDYSPFRRRRHGNTSAGLPATRFVVCSQNHDQVGNRMLGERLIGLAGLEAHKLAAAAVILSPSLCLLFMGEEWAEENPFLYFVSHSDPALCATVRNGRKEEFKGFHEDGGEPPDPVSTATFLRSQCDWSRLDKEFHRSVLAWYRTLIALRKTHPVFSSLSRDGLVVDTDERNRIVRVIRGEATDRAVCFYNFSDTQTEAVLPVGTVPWTILLDSSDTQWAGPGTVLPRQAQPGQRVILKSRSFCAWEERKS
ncbi:MAG: malto-oligosyltrehalose trehalohydrolase [Chitinispirillaceae bacterium]|nr:malto-oligosyltrehalose trehalohydrolase [Chitinispirillaceae bacterium]